MLKSSNEVYIEMIKRKKEEYPSQERLIRKIARDLVPHVIEAYLKEDREISIVHVDADKVNPDMYDWICRFALDHLYELKEKENFFNDIKIEWNQNCFIVNADFIYD